MHFWQEMNLDGLVLRAKVSMHFAESWEIYQNQVDHWGHLQTAFPSKQIWLKYLNSFSSKSAWSDLSCSYYGDFAFLGLVLWASRFGQFSSTFWSFPFPALPRLPFHSDLYGMLLPVWQVFLHATVRDAVLTLLLAELSKWQLLVYPF